MKPFRKTKSANAGCVRRLVSRRREQLAIEALVALALRNDTEPVTAAEIERYTRRPVRLSREDAAALKRARPKLLAALKREKQSQINKYAIL